MTQYLTANSDRLSHFGHRMSLFLQTPVLHGILFSEQEHRQEQRQGGSMNRSVYRVMVSVTHRIPAAEGRSFSCPLLGTVSLIPLSSVAFAASLSEQLRAQNCHL